MSDTAASGNSSFADYVGILGRRKWVLILPLLLVPIVAFMISSREQAKYKATSEVLLNRHNIVSATTGVGDTSSIYLDPVRLATTEADVARSPQLATRVATASHVRGLTAGDVLAQSSVTPRADADLLDFAVIDPNPAIAARIATAYAQEYTSFRNDLDTAAVRNAISKLQSKIDRLHRRGFKDSSPLVQQLAAAQDKLETSATLLTATRTVIRPAYTGEKVSPQPKRAAALGGLLGLILGIVLALASEALDTRVRGSGAAEADLQLPLLARIPAPPRRLQAADKLVMVSASTSIDAEPYRQLRTSLEFANLDVGAHTILITSAVEQEGKSTTLANLAVAYARAGRRTVLIDLDLRRPAIHRYFGLPASPGVTDVASGRVDLAGAIRPIGLGEGGVDRGRLRSLRSATGSEPNGGTSREREPASNLFVLTAGTLPVDPGEFVASAECRKLIEAASRGAEIVLIDTPPILLVSDATTLSAYVDAMFVAVRLNETQHQALNDLARRLDSCPAKKLGFVATGVPPIDAYRYGYTQSGHGSHAGT
jgi:Mrp family chromosome partitioning ATPase/capsular polysaccharide biosynthesis protein